MSLTIVSRAILSVALLGCAACGNTGFADFDGQIVGGPSCFQEFLPFESAFQTSQQRSDSVTLSFQSDGGIPTGKDLVFIIATDTDTLQPGETYTFDEPISFESEHVGQLSLRETCPDQILDYYITGEYSLTEFNPVAGETVAGAISNGAVVDRRTGAVVVENFTGAWDFTYETGPPYESFP